MQSGGGKFYTYFVVGHLKRWDSNNFAFSQFDENIFEDIRFSLGNANGVLRILQQNLSYTEKIGYSYVIALLLSFV